MAVSKTRKLYCYVDETGQDTLGRLFIVVAIMTERPRIVSEALEVIEASSGKGKRKWHLNSSRKRDAYIRAALTPKQLIRAYYQVFHGDGISYELVTVEAIASAIHTHCRTQLIQDYKATVIIDGLRRTQSPRVAKLLRSSGIRTRSVRGARDEAEPMIRLADAVAGLLRQAYLGDVHFEKERERLESQQLLIEL